MQWAEKRKREAKLDEQRKAKLEYEAKIRQKADESAKLDARRKAKLDEEKTAAMVAVLEEKTRNPKKCSRAQRASTKAEPNSQAEEIMGHKTSNLVGFKSYSLDTTKTSIC